MATPQDFDGNFLFCRILFRNASDGDGDGWGVDYPRADINLTFGLSELTKTTVTRDSEEGYNHVVVRLTDPLLYRCPFVMMTEPGGAFFDDAEAEQLRNYLLKGGLLWADDFWGDYAFDHWAGQIGKALPREGYPIVDVPLDHVLFHTLYDIRRIPQIPSINFWGRSGQTSERGRRPSARHHEPGRRSYHGADDAQHRLRRCLRTRRATTTPTSRSLPRGTHPRCQRHCSSMTHRLENRSR